MARECEIFQREEQFQKILTRPSGFFTPIQRISLLDQIDNFRPRFIPVHSNPGWTNQSSKTTPTKSATTIKSTRIKSAWKTLFFFSPRRKRGNRKLSQSLGPFFPIESVRLANFRFIFYFPLAIQTKFDCVVCAVTFWGGFKVQFQFPLPSQITRRRTWRSFEDLQTRWNSIKDNWINTERARV